MSSRGEQVLIAANPKSGSVSSRQRVADLRQALTDRGFGCHVCHSLEQVQQESLRLQQGGCLRAVVSAGGDGTADALTNLLPSHLPLLVFPLGTENLLAKYLGIHGDVRQACDILQADQRLAIDVGRANGQLFLVMLSCGFDAEVVRQMHARRTGHINRWSYTRPIYSALRNYRFQQLRFETDAPQAASEHWPLDAAAWLFVFNIPRYAASLNFCPQADPCDGLLDVCLFQRSGILSGLGYLTRLWLGSHQKMPGFRHIRCRRLSVEGPPAEPEIPAGNWPATEIPYQLDGDPGGVLPLNIDVLPARITLLVPPQSS